MTKERELEIVIEYLRSTAELKTDSEEEPEKNHDFTVAKAYAETLLGLIRHLEKEP